MSLHSSSSYDDNCKSNNEEIDLPDSDKINELSSNDESFIRKTEYKTKSENDKWKRLDYLLKQSEMFSQFINNINNTATSLSIKRQNKRRKIESIVDLANGVKNSEHLNVLNIHKFQCTPNYIKNGELRSYQIDGLNWLISLYENGMNGILADEMGLGKTLQTISLLGYLRHFKKINGPHLIVAPKTTLENWIYEINKWCPEIKVECLIGYKNDRKIILRNLSQKNWDVCVTSYEMCWMESGWLQKIDWHYFIIDEGHRIKNEGSRLSKAIRKYKSLNRLLLTGTPFQNNLHELWALLNFLLPDVFNSSEDFDSWFNTNSCLGDQSLVKRLHVILKPFVLKRIKANVEQGLLPKIEEKVYVEQTKLQEEWKKKIFLGEMEYIRSDGYIAKRKYNFLFVELRKCASHPYLLDSAEPGPPYTTDEHLVYNSGKMAILDKMLRSFKRQNSKVLIFSQMTRMLDIIEDYCVWRNYQYCRIDGQTQHENRFSLIQEFNSENSTKFIFMLSTRAGGLGINLTAADKVIIYDSDWNPQMDLQAMDRAHRIGQKNQVFVYRLITKDTIEEKMLEVAESKLKLDKLVIQDGLTHLKNYIDYETDLLREAKIKSDLSDKHPRVKN